MEPIVTKSFKLDKNEINQFINPLSKSRKVAKTLGDIFIVLFCIPIVEFLLNYFIDNILDTFPFEMLFPIGIILAYRASRKRNEIGDLTKLDLKPHVITFKTDEMSILYYDGKVINILYESILKNFSKYKSYVLQKDYSEMTIIPQTAFQSEEDHQKFRELFNFND